MQNQHDFVLTNCAFEIFHFLTLAIVHMNAFTSVKGRLNIVHDRKTKLHNSLYDTHSISMKESLTAIIPIITTRKCCVKISNFTVHGWNCWV